MDFCECDSAFLLKTFVVSWHLPESPADTLLCMWFCLFTLLWTIVGRLVRVFAMLPDIWRKIHSLKRLKYILLGTVRMHRQYARFGGLHLTSFKKHRNSGFRATIVAVAVYSYFHSNWKGRIPFLLFGATESVQSPTFCIHTTKNCDKLCIEVSTFACLWIPSKIRLLQH